MGTGPLAAIVVACASHIDQETVDRWAADGSLFTSAHPQGRIPGEGAAGVLLADVRQAQSARDTAFALLEPACEARHAVSADDVRRADPLLLGELAERALERIGVAPLDVVMVVGDTGHGANRVFELMGFAAINLPQLDGIGDVGCVGTAMGACGAVPFVTALALARHHALKREAPVLFVGNEDPLRRTVAVVRAPVPSPMIRRPVDNSLDKRRVNGG